MPPDLPPPFDAAWFRFLIGAIIGACLGSFGTMLAYRLPRHMSIVAPRSHCPSCKATLGIRDLLPLLSFLVTGGKCRYCHAKIGIRYLYIEIACTVIGGLVGIGLVYL